MSYPAINHECESGLLLYGCAFNGKNDGQYLRDAGLLDVTVVDHHGPYVRAMQPEYPPEWTFVTGDCLAWLAANADARFDIISVDAPHKGTDALTRLMQEFGLDGLYPMARKMLVFGAPTNWKVPVDARIVPRSMEFCWWVWDK